MLSFKQGCLIQYLGYQNSRNLSWEYLLKYNITELPVSITALCNQIGIQVRSFDEVAPYMPRLTEWRKTHQLDGHIRITKLGTPVILYDSSVNEGRQRFTIAHELGHYALGHLKKEPRIWTRGLFRTLDNESTPEEAEANVFASRLLAPACVLWALKVESIEEVMQRCGLSREAAEYRTERLYVLYARESQYWREKGHSCFLQSPLERQVYEQFIPYIHSTMLLPWA